MMNSSFFATVYEKGFQSTLLFLKAKGAGADEAEEFAQAAWARGWEARGQLKDPGSLLAWVNTIALNKMFSATRRLRHVQHIERVDSLHAPASTIIEKIDADRMLTRCSSLDRKLLLDRYESGFDHDEIAVRHGMSSIAVRVRIHRSRHALRGQTTTPLSSAA